MCIDPDVLVEFKRRHHRISSAIETSAVSGIPPSLGQPENALTWMPASPLATSCGIINDRIISDPPELRVVLTEPMPTLVSPASKMLTVIRGRDGTVRLEPDLYKSGASRDKAGGFPPLVGHLY